MSTKPKTIDDYLVSLSKEKRAALENLRRAIKSAAPKAEECISYNIPAFRLAGRLLVAFGAAANHCAFYPMRIAQLRPGIPAMGATDRTDITDEDGTARSESGETGHGSHGYHG